MTRTSSEAIPRRVMYLRMFARHAVLCPAIAATSNNTGGCVLGYMPVKLFGRRQSLAPSFIKVSMAIAVLIPLSVDAGTCPSC